VIGILRGGSYITITSVVVEWVRSSELQIEGVDAWEERAEHFPSFGWESNFISRCKSTNIVTYEPPLEYMQNVDMSRLIINC